VTGLNGQEHALNNSTQSNAFMKTLGCTGHTPNTTLFCIEDDERPSGKVTAGKILTLLQFQRHKCAVSGIELSPSTASVDHIVSLKDGGGTTMENLQILHREVNRIKGSLSISELDSWCRQIVLGLRLIGFSTFQKEGGDDDHRTDDHRAAGPDAPHGR
jgi:hypothetical protein